MAVDFFAVAAEAFFAAFLTGADLAAVPFAPGPPRAAPPVPFAAPPRRVAEDTLCATLGAFSAIALPICGARLET